jgi:hypothetical protein
MPNPVISWAADSGGTNSFTFTQHHTGIKRSAVDRQHLIAVAAKHGQTVIR